MLQGRKGAIVKKRNMTRAIYVPTLVDAQGHRHIIPSKGAFALCGVEIGAQEAPHDHRIDTLCLRCRQKYMRGIVDERMTRFGL